MSRPVAPPSGWPAPATVTLAGREVELTPLAEAVADRYFAEFPGDLSRYGDAARAWEVHDTAYCLQWAILDVEGWDDLGRQVAWLTGILRSRGFPLEQLARNLELAADVVGQRLADGGGVAARLRSSAAGVRASPEPS